MKSGLPGASASFSHTGAATTVLLIWSLSDGDKSVATSTGLGLNSKLRVRSETSCVAPSPAGGASSTKAPLSNEAIPIHIVAASGLSVGRLARIKRHAE